MYDLQRWNDVDKVKAIIRQSYENVIVDEKKLKSFQLNLFVHRPARVNETCMPMKTAYDHLVRLQRASRGIPDYFTNDEVLESRENGLIKML